MTIPKRLRALVATYDVLMAEWLRACEDRDAGWRELESRRIAVEDAAIDIADYLVGVVRAEGAAKGGA